MEAGRIMENRIVPDEGLTDDSKGQVLSVHFHARERVGKPRRNPKKKKPLKFLHFSGLSF